MTAVSGKVRVNRPYFFTDTDGGRAEFPAFGTGSGDLEGNQLREYEMYVRAKQIDALPISAPSNDAAPVIAGDAEVGATLALTAGEWSGDPAPAVSAVWQISDDGDSGWAAIPGETGESYLVDADDEGKFIRVLETAENIAGSDDEPSNVIGPITTA